MSPRSRRTTRRCASGRRSGTCSCSSRARSPPPSSPSGRGRPQAERDPAASGDPAGARDLWTTEQELPSPLLSARAVGPRPRAQPGGRAFARGVPRGRERGPRSSPARPARRVGRLRVRAGGPGVHRPPEPLRDAAGAVRGTVGSRSTSPRPSADQALRDRSPASPGHRPRPHFIFAKDEDGRFLLANRAVAEAYGTTVDALRGRTDADFARSAEEVRNFGRTTSR